MLSPQLEVYYIKKVFDQKIYNLIEIIVNLKRKVHWGKT